MNVLVKCKDNRSGFETALVNIQLEYKENQNPENKARLESFNSCLQKIFSDMDESFQKLGSLDIDENYLIDRFIDKFDAVFTLNQDSLFERCVRVGAGSTATDPLPPVSRWNFHYFPGMKFLENPHTNPIPPLIYTTEEKFKINKQSKRKPYFKLHGLYNWQTKHDKEIIIDLFRNSIFQLPIVQSGD